ncbi:hypothetical protein SDJN02_09421 [Cucurbita argyrosperma subsp. argyrosperma]|nr:hypothetical protein SDJN02_09421 [Cucurbita argyrosperma subsp. argyrosperma]
MVGIFSRFSSSRTGHRRAQSALDGREGLPSIPETTGVSDTTAAAASHGIEVAVEFKPDGRIWKERVSSLRRMPDMPVMKEPEIGETRPRATRTILPSMSAPEHNILNLLEESGI